MGAAGWSGRSFGAMLRRRIQATDRKYTSGATHYLTPLLGRIVQSPPQFTLLVQNHQPWEQQGHRDPATYRGRADASARR